MKLSTAFMSVAAAVATVSALQAGTAPPAADDVVDVFAREALDHPLAKRACTPSACLCNKVQGQFCGDHSINPNCQNDHVYECNGSTGKTCDYGYRDSCAQCHALFC